MQQTHQSNCILAKCTYYPRKQLAYKLNWGDEVFRAWGFYYNFKKPTLFHEQIMNNLLALNFRKFLRELAILSMLPLGKESSADPRQVGKANRLATAVKWVRYLIMGVQKDLVLDPQSDQMYVNT